MPPQVVPPMYRMLQEELEWARNDVSAGLRAVPPRLRALPPRRGAGELIQAA